MAYAIFDNFSKSALEEVCRLFEQSEEGAFCPLGLLVERTGRAYGPAPSAASVASVLVAPAGVDRDRVWDVVYPDAAEFIAAWDSGRVTSASLRAAMGLPVR